MALFRLDRRRAFIGLGIGILALIACGILNSWKAGFLFAMAFLLAGCVKITPKHPAIRFGLNAVWGVVCIFVSCALPTMMISNSSYLNIGYYRIAMNFICVAVVYGIFLTAFGEIRRAVAVASGLLLIMATANTFVFQFRGNELKPMDFFSIKTALNVAGQYTFRISPRMLQGWLIWLWAVFCLGSLPPSDPGIRKYWLRLGAAVASCLCAFLLWRWTPDVRTNNWSNGGSTSNGYYLNFYTGVRDCFAQKPEGYSPEAVEEIASHYTEQREGVASKPNIIVIMNESFADFRVLGDKLRTNQPVTPFFDSLQNNAIRGYALTSVFGGVTANSEFEFLTGSSMANLPAGTVPYQQYVTEDIYSLPWLMSALGYCSVATHPFNASGWNRPAVYPRLGFAESTFVDAYPYKKLVREFVSDQEMYEYVLNTLTTSGEKPQFLFGITMQNHGDYIYIGDNYEQSVFLEGYDGDYPMAEQYLTLLRESDKALEYFLTELEKAPEDTVVLFFGDHFPQVEGDFFQEVHGGAFETLPEKMEQYMVPFLVWANFDIPEQTVECTSLNYLGRYLLETAGLELPPYYQFLKELEQAVPAVNALGYYSISQQTFLPLEDAQGEEAKWLNDYAMVQYNNLFDQKNRNPLFFQNYLP